jgi:predicted alpha/beta-hydrolase family hydrolase
MIIRIRWSVILFSCFALYSSNAFSGSFIALKTRSDVKQPFWLIEKDNADASVILFAGGKGRLKIDEDGIGRVGNFLVRNRKKFAEHNFNVAVVDVPTDRKKLYYFRTTEEHATDIKTVIKFMRDKYKKPVWLIGTSRGTTSAAAVASRLKDKEGPDGIVLTAAISRGGKKGESVNDVALADIEQPVLFVHHEDDECGVCPASAVETIAESMFSAKITEIKMFSGGYTQGRECGAQSYHGFLGIDNDVVKYISGWVKTH